MQRAGWVTAQGPGTEFVSMPGTEFFNFRPNINVFDSKGKACWKWLALAAAEDANSSDADESEAWEALWTIAENELAWSTMSTGADTLFVTPNTTFEKFQPNVTIFQSKKRAVLQCLALQKVKITLGDSVEGPQVLDFANTDASKLTKQTPTKVTGDSFTTPQPKKTVPSAASSGKKASSSSKTTPPSGKKTPSSSSKSSKKTPPTKSTASSKKASASKSPKTPSSASKSASKTKKPEPLFHFHAPEFRCTFGIVYEQLQIRGWYHRSGAFEYDYFSPEYTKETAIPGGNYFQSQAQLEAFLKDSGVWQEVEDELRVEHAELVEELRHKAERKHQQLKERLAAKQKADASGKKKTTASKAASTQVATKKGSSQAASLSPAATAATKTNTTSTAGAKRKSSFAESAQTLPPQVKITFGKVEEKLKRRGWTCKPGRFEYDYFKPGVTLKTARLNEDYFQSTAELETYLKISGMWDDLAKEIQDEYIATLARDDAEDEQAQATGAEASRQRSASTKKPRVATPTTSPAAAETEEVLEPAAAALTNDIWGNSHQFEFDQ